ncbi:hypothetical protein GP475_00225 [Corynebacterium poyangense]|uniref:ABC-2 type transporter transmembrane domain-containing protein n=1 Tax=Corynebacterium poyangense TaxID=2684405 RepID=A0A7H0SL02_9CORY|nr:YhgE/Pip family protein [Corynebacterium poyangense]QNQ89227.1 hypothetical protein GP475_00225 [Corynebacterium poyangense]
MSNLSDLHSTKRTIQRRRLWIRSSIIIVLVAPLLVAAAWMWSMWDPSHYLSEVKLAVVNEDLGTQQDGKQVSYGADVVKGLLETDYLNFTVENSSNADKGLRTGEYMAVLSIPKNFSSDIATVVNSHPKQPEVIISYNDHYGTNTPLLTSGLIPGIQQGIQMGISQGYGAQILDGLNKLGSGLNAASEGAKQLDDGMGQLKDGTAQGVDGTRQLKDGTEQLLNGAVQLDDGMSQLLDGTGKLGTGASQIDEGVGQLTGTLIPLLRQVGSVVSGITPVINQLENLGLHSQAQELRNSISALDNSSPDALSNQLQKLKSGTAEMSYNLNDPRAPYLSGVLQLKNGTSQLKDGANQLDDGMSQMKDGSFLLDDGARQLKEGTNQLRKGLSEGAQQAPKIEDIESSSHQIAVPVGYVQDYRHPVQTLQDLNNPTSKVLSEGVTMILILVFGFLAMALSSMLTPHLLGSRKHRGFIRPVLAGFGLLAAVNLAILTLLTWAGSAASFSIDSPLGFGVAIILIASNGTACFQMLRIVFGQLVGASLALGYFAYGVFCFGGVWPTQLTPAPLKALHYLHPMSYARDIYVRSVDSNFDGTFYRAVLVLIISTLCFLGVSICARMVKTMRNNKWESENHVDHIIQERYNYV